MSPNKNIKLKFNQNNNNINRELKNKLINQEEEYPFFFEYEDDDDPVIVFENKNNNKNDRTLKQLKQPEQNYFSDLSDQIKELKNLISPQRKIISWIFRSKTNQRRQSKRLYF